MPTQRLINILTFLWLGCYSSLLYAAAITPATYAQDARAYDFESLVLAACAAGLGGLGRTLLSLMNRNVLLRDVWVEAAKDLVVSMVVGALALLILLAVAPLLPAWFGRDQRMLFVLGAGILRTKFLNMSGDILSDAFTRLRAWVRGSPIPKDVDPPPSAISPLEAPK